jgi:hypothetical protein
VSILDETRYIERLQFFNGQRLFAPDLQGIDDFNRGMRWLHNLSLHQAGIGSGFAVYGNKGDREVTIKPGYAIDDLGREIVFTHVETVPVPPVAGDGKGNSIFYDLTVSYPDDSALEEAETREGVCLARGVVRLREEPVFCWVELAMGPDGFLPRDPILKAEVQTHRKIILAQIEVLNCQLNQPVCIAHRPDARPDCGPYIACGKQEPAPWTEVKFEKAPVFLGARTGGLFAFTAEINTSSAGFLTVPCYSANIPGPRVMPVSSIGEEASSEDVLIVDLLHVQTAEVDRFKVFLLVLGVPLTRRTGNRSIEKAIRNSVAAWPVVWMGVEG